MCTLTEPGSHRPCAAGRDQHRLIEGKLGPSPEAALRAMVGYGLNEREIGRYFGVTPSSIRRLKRSLNVASSGPD